MQLQNQSNSQTIIIAGVVAGLVAAVVGAGFWLAFKDRKPPEVPYEESGAYKMSKAMKKTADHWNEIDKKK